MPPASLEPIRNPALIEALAGLVRSKKIETRVSCAFSLGFAQVSEARALELLEVLVQDSEPRVRTAAAQALVRLAAHTPLAVPALRHHALGSSEQETVQAALEAIVRCRCTHPDVAAHLEVLATGKRLVPPPRGEDWPVSGSKVRWVGHVAQTACDALRVFPPSIGVPIFRRLLRESDTQSTDARERWRILDALLAVAPDGGEALEDLLDLLKTWGEPYADLLGTFEREAKDLLELLLAGGAPAPLLLRRLAEVRRPDLRAFVPRLRALLGQAGLEPETLAAVHRGLTAWDKLRTANALHLLSCSPEQARAAESLITARLESTWEPVREAAADTLGTLAALKPETLEALTRLVQRSPEGAAARAAREQLARHGAPVPLPPGGVGASQVLEGVLPLPFLIGSGQLLGADGALYFPWLRVERKAPEDQKSTDEDTVGLARVRLGPEGPRLDVFPLPPRLPQASTGGHGQKRWMTLSVRLEDDLLCTLRRPFSSSSGWGEHHFFLRFSPATQTWSQVVKPSEGPFQGVPIDDQLEVEERAVGGGTLLVWVDVQGALRTQVDPTPYFLEGAEPTLSVKAAYEERDAACEAATRHHLLEVKEPRGQAQEPWRVGAPGEKLKEPEKPRKRFRWPWEKREPEEKPNGLHLYGVRTALFAQHPRLRPENVDFIRCQGAHQLLDATGRPHLVLFVEAQLYEKAERLQSVLVLRAPNAWR